MWSGSGTGDGDVGHKVVVVLVRGSLTEILNKISGTTAHRDSAVVATQSSHKNVTRELLD